MLSPKRKITGDMSISADQLLEFGTNGPVSGTAVPLANRGFWEHMRKRILIIEDDPLVAMMLEEALQALGHEVVGGAGDIASALSCIEEEEFEAAIVDVYLQSGLPCDAVAEELSARSIPFLVATGGFVGQPGPCWNDRPILAKPFTLDSLEVAIASLD